MKIRFAIALVVVAGCSSGGPTTVPSPLVQGIHLSQIASYQTLRATLMKDGAANDMPEVPLIAGRPLMLRAFVTPDDGWDGHEIIVRFEMTSDGTALDAVEIHKSFGAASTESDLESTANLNLTADQVTPDLTYLVSLHEEKPGPEVKNDGAIWPRQPGETCDSQRFDRSECVSSTACSLLSNTCLARQLNGAACTEDAGCLSNFCAPDQTCKTNQC